MYVFIFISLDRKEQDNFWTEWSLLHRGKQFRFTEKLTRKMFHSRHQGNTQIQRAKCQKTWPRLVLYWRYLQENDSLDLHRNRRCLHSQHEMQQYCCICIHIRQLWFTDCNAQIVKQDWILWTGTFIGSMMEKWNLRPFSSAMNFGFISLNTWNLRVGVSPY
jgi:hypothetical protein